MQKTLSYSLLPSGQRELPVSKVEDMVEISCIYQLNIAFLLRAFSTIQLLEIPPGIGQSFS